MSREKTNRSRLLTNVVRLPSRAVESIARRLSRAYRLQRAADRYAKTELSREKAVALSAVPGTTSDRQCRLLLHQAVSAPANGVILEIGAYKGKSTAWLAEAARRCGKRMFSIDPLIWDTEEEFRNTIRQFEIEQVATLHKGFSHDFGQSWKEPIAFLWIDGGHDYETVRQDIIDFAPHVVSGGVIVFDDANVDTFPGVVQALEETLIHDANFDYLGNWRGQALFRRR